MWIRIIWFKSEKVKHICIERELKCDGKWMVSGQQERNKNSFNSNHSEKESWVTVHSIFLECVCSARRIGGSPHLYEFFVVIRYPLFAVNAMHKLEIIPNYRFLVAHSIVTKMKWTQQQNKQNERDGRKKEGKNVGDNETGSKNRKLMGNNKQR